MDNFKLFLINFFCICVYDKPMINDKHAFELWIARKFYQLHQVGLNCLFGKGGTLGSDVALHLVGVIVII